MLIHHPFKRRYIGIYICKRRLGRNMIYVIKDNYMKKVVCTVLVGNRANRNLVGIFPVSYVGLVWFDLVSCHVLIAGVD